MASEFLSEVCPTNYCADTVPEMKASDQIRELTRSLKQRTGLLFATMVAFSIYCALSSILFIQLIAVSPSQVQATTVKENKKTRDLINSNAESIKDLTKKHFDLLEHQSMLREEFYRINPEINKPTLSILESNNVK